MTQPTNPQPLLKVENLRVRLPSPRGVVRAVDGVSLLLEQGRTLGLVGESGCGKSMLARALMGLLPRDSIIGEQAVVEFQGKDLLRLPTTQLRQITGNRMAMILISHDLGVVADRTHTTAVMYAGKIVEIAPTNMLFNNMAMPYTQALMDAIPRVEDPPHTQLKAIAGQPPDLAHPLPGCRFAPRCQLSTPRCHQQEPNLIRINEIDHWVSCWHPLKPS
jgi:oligopeptide/dipeptide ABC transporter ATP-binding protein